MDKNSKIYIAGHNGMVGCSIKRALEKRGYNNIIYKSSKELDLRRQSNVEEFFMREKPEYVFLAAAKVGGIMANINAPAEFIYDNIMINSNVIHAAYKNEVKKLMFLGSSCIYPRDCNQPMKEEYLLDGKLEPTNEGYALAKISGLKMCELYNKQYGTEYISVMPSNIYGPNDNFSKESSHVLASLIRKIHEGMVLKSDYVEVWGTGNALREFLYVDDMADACLFLMENYSGKTHVNVGTGQDISIRALAETIKEIIGYKGELAFNKSMPDGMPRKLTSVELINSLGWESKISLKEGIKLTYNWYLNNMEGIV
ncbi:MAG: GDP-L-fucose synthase family protein [Clostridium sp.]